jgi:nitrate reductase cytochrome c-type subunit
MERSLKYRDLSFIVIIVFVVSGLQLLARVNRPPETPRDSSHSGVGHDMRDQCLRCHQRAARSETDAADQPHKQPKRWRADKTDCLLCHRYAVR